MFSALMNARPSHLLDPALFDFAVHDRLAHWQRLLRWALARAEILALFPVLVFVAYRFAGPEAVVAAAMLLPLLLVLARQGDRHALPGVARPGREALLAMLDRIAGTGDMDSACLAIAIDDWDAIRARWGGDTAEGLRQDCAHRLRWALRGDDLLAEIGEGRFGVVLHPMPAARLAIREEIVDRLRAALSEPFVVDGATVRLTASAGHAALIQTGPDAAAATLAGAEAALEEARLAGPNSVRAHVPGRTAPRPNGSPLAEEVADALASGAILPWFQPQVDVRTGAVAGFEALARWQHPRLGLLGPGRFLDAVVEAGQVEALGTTIRAGAIAALRSFDRSGGARITVSVNASAEELRNPTYAEQIAWDLDRHDLQPGRLIVEVLETVAADASDDSVVATLAALRSQGVGIDLDDFGIGQASLASIRRYGVQRIKIDRSFVIGVDTDKGQQAVVSAIVSLGREMGITTLAEGVETPQERETLERLGCGWVQGFAIGKPMPLRETLDWLAARPPLKAEASAAQKILRGAKTPLDLCPPFC
jgi:diguanylate cyclase